MPADAFERSGKNRRARAWCAAFLFCVLALGWATLGGYGQPWDEWDEMDILRMNLWEYALALGQDDSAFVSWAEGRKAVPPVSLLGSPVPISQSAERDHGQSAYYPLAPVMMNPGVSPSALSTVWHGYSWLVFWLGAAALFFVCRHIGLSRPLSCAAVAMLVLSPRFFAEGHYNNKDITLMAFVLLTLWQGLRLSERPGPTTALAFGLCGAIATNTRIIGLAVFGLCGLFVAARLGLSGRLNRRALALGAAALLAYVGFYALLTPALWSGPLDFVKYVLQNAAGFTRWKGLVLFRGVVFDTSVSPLPWYYLPYTMFVSTPLWVWLFFAPGQALSMVHLLGGRRKELAARLPLLLPTLLWAVPLCFAMGSRTVAYNGWRHFYFLYGPMLALAAYGLSWLWEHVRAVPWQRYATLVALLLCAALAAVGMALNHPYQYVFYNSTIPVQSLNDYMERDYWNVSMQSALDALRQSEAYRALPSPVLVGGADLWAQSGVRQALAFAEDTGLTLAEGADEMDEVDGEKPPKPPPDFLLVNHTYQRYSGWQPSPGMIPVVQVEAYGRPLTTIYQGVNTTPRKEAP